MPSAARSCILARRLRAILFLTQLLLLLLAARAASAATIVVNDASDTLHSPGCADTGTGACTLRDAITFANANPGPDSITFAVPGPGVRAITLGSDLPASTGPVTIDGYTQPGSSANTNGDGLGDNAVLLIEINGNGMGCLSLQGGHNAVRGLVINRCAGAAILLPSEDLPLPVRDDVIEGNFIGTDPTGATAKGNRDGVVIRGGCDVTVGATPALSEVPAAAARNVISGNSEYGVWISALSPNLVAGNFIGTNAAGTGTLSNQAGVYVEDFCCGPTACSDAVGGPLIGGNSRGSRNLISGNAVGVTNGETADFTIQGNLIGTDVTGSMAVPNSCGLSLHSEGVEVGGAAPGAGNLISGNLDCGIDLDLMGPTIEGNRIGTDITNAKPLGNGRFGIYVFLGLGDAPSGVIRHNLIAYNGAAASDGGGVGVFAGEPSPSPRIPLIENSIFGNTSDGSKPNRGLGIDLGVDGVTLNDACDADSGPNDLLNFPVLTSAIAGVVTTRIRGSASSGRIEFFANDTCDPSGYGEGRTFLGAIEVAADTCSSSTFDVTLPVSVEVGQYVTATTTVESLGSSETSEFSACQVVTAATLDVGSIDPSSGPATGGTPLAITGLGFDGGASAALGGAPSSDSSVISPTLLTTTAPALTPGTLNDVVVTNSDESNATLPRAWMADFQDVPRFHLFHRVVERIFRSGITVGCAAGLYCPDDPVTRSTVAILLARSIAGGSSNVPAHDTIGGRPYFCQSGGISLFDDVAPTDISCKGVHFLAASNVTVGCFPTQFCPAELVRRDELAGFVARAIVTPGGGAAVPVSYGPDPVTGRAYSCDAAAPNLHFTDVSVTDPFCKHVHFLWAKGIVGGCSPTEFCPSSVVTRGEMAKFLANAFVASP